MTSRGRAPSASAPPGSAPGRSGTARALIVLLAGVGSAVAILLAEGAEAPLSKILAAAALVYAGSAALRSPRAAWPLFVLTCLVITLTRFVGGNPAATWVFLLLAAGVLAWAALRHHPPGLRVQWVGLLAFGLIAATSLTGGGWAAGLVAAGLLAHSAWDLVHLVRRWVVPASMALFCLALDSVLGVAILVAVGLG